MTVAFANDEERDIWSGTRHSVIRSWLAWCQHLILTLLSLIRYGHRVGVFEELMLVIIILTHLAHKESLVAFPLKVEKHRWFHALIFSDPVDPFLALDKPCKYKLSILWSIHVADLRPVAVSTFAVHLSFFCTSESAPLSQLIKIQMIPQHSPFFIQSELFPA